MFLPSIFWVRPRLPLTMMVTIAFTLIAGPTDSVAQFGFDTPPINYMQTRGNNPVSKLIERVESGETELTFDPVSGYLTSILDELDIPLSSQCLVFSKTSLQSGRISPSNPRAIYFSDEVYVAWVHGSSLLEVSTQDPNLGAVFYSIQMSPRRPYMRRENNRCLACHETTLDGGKVSIHTVRSVMTRSSGKINLLLKAFVTGHDSPIEDRWGGWYVTGGHGDMKHMGNAFLEGEKLVPHNHVGSVELESQFNVSRWPLPDSDIVALMVMEHQTQMHNHFTRANYAVRRALFQARQDEDSVDVETVIDDAAKRVVDYLLFVDEIKLRSPVTCSNSFTQDFLAKGPVSAKGQSLREFDLSTRLFRYPCSYLIYSPSFDAMHDQLRDRVLERLHNILIGKDLSPEYAHLDQDTRQTVLSILRQTKSTLPANWNVSVAQLGG